MLKTRIVRAQVYAFNRATTNKEIADVILGFADSISNATDKSTRRDSDPDSDSKQTTKETAPKNTKKENTWKYGGLSFHEIIFDSSIVSALKHLFRSISIAAETKRDRTPDPSPEGAKVPGRKTIPSDGSLTKFEFTVRGCSENGYLEQALEAALASGVVDRFHIQGIESNRNIGRVRRWMDIPPSERPLVDTPYVMPSLRPFGGFQNKCNSNSNSNSNRQSKVVPRVLLLSSLAVSKSDLRHLRTGVFAPGGGLLNLVLSRVSFKGEGVVSELGEVLSAMSQARSDEPKSGFLRELTLNHGLCDAQVEFIIWSLMMTPTQLVRRDKGTDLVSIARNSSTLINLRLNFDPWEGKALTALGAWLVETQPPFGQDDSRPFSVEAMEAMPKFDSSSVCSCSLESLNLTGGIRFRPQHLVRHYRHLLSKTKNTNNTLKTLSFSYGAILQITWDNDMKDGFEELGLFVSKHLICLEELCLMSIDLTDAGLTSFTTGACTDVPTLPASTATPTVAIDPNLLLSLGNKNLSLENLKFNRHRLTEGSYSSMARLLDRFPSLRPPLCFPSSSKFWRLAVCQKPSLGHQINVNFAGRLALFPSRSKDLLPMALWPTILEGIPRRLKRRMMSLCLPGVGNSANAIFFFLRNRIELMTWHQQLSASATAPSGAETKTTTGTLAAAESRTDETHNRYAATKRKIPYDNNNHSDHGNDVDDDAHGCHQIRRL